MSAEFKEKNVKRETQVYKKIKSNVLASIFCCVLCIFTSAQSLKLFGKYCDLKTGDRTKLCYVKETLAVLTHSPNQLAVEKTTNTLYFSFDFDQGEYIPGVLRIDTKKLSVLKGPKDAFAIAVNDTSGDVYFGGSHGIYKYNSVSKSLKQLAEKNLDIWWLFVKNEMLYYIKFPALVAYCYHNKTNYPIDILQTSSVQQFVVDNDDNFFFMNSSGLYCVRNDSDFIYILKSDAKFVGMAMDNKGDIFVSAEDGIYMVIRSVPKVKRVVNIPGVLGLTFDKNNYLIYSDSHEITRLIAVSSNKFNDINMVK